MTASFTLIVTGANGFIGNALLHGIARHMPDLSVIALVRSEVACEQLTKLPIKLTLRRGSLQQLPSDLLPQTPHVLVHLAVKQIDRNGRGFDEDNIDGTRRLLSQVNNYTWGIIYNSSLSVYGEDPQRGINESVPLNPQTALARSRAAAEQLIREHMAAHNRWALLLRPRFVLGRGDRFVLPGLLGLSRKGLSVGSGQQRFSIINVDDYAAILLHLAHHIAQQPECPQQQALNVGYRTPVRFADLIDALRERYSLTAPRVTIAVPVWLIRICTRLPIPALQYIARKLSLIGLDHYADTCALAGLVGNDIVGRSPQTALRRAVAALAVCENPLKNTGESGEPNSV
jgi:nucleoside-diphosphate-sugar epimerase